MDSMPQSLHATGDVPDTYIGRFVDRLNHVQNGLLKPLQNDVATLKLLVHEHANTISSLRKITRAHGDTLVMHEKKSTEMGTTLARLSQAPPQPTTTQNVASP